MYLNTIFATDGFVALRKRPCEYGTTMWHFFSTWGSVGFSFLLLDFFLLSCFRTLFIAHLGYLHLIRTFSICCNSHLRHEEADPKDSKSLSATKIISVFENLKELCYTT